MADDDLSPWFGVGAVEDEPRRNIDPIDRRRPQEERALQAAEILAGFRGDQLDKAVTFRDLQRLQESLIASSVEASASSVQGAIGTQLAGQLAAINTESKALVDAFEDLFAKAQDDITTLGTEVDAELSTFETTYNGEIARIDQLIASIDGDTVTWAIRADNNGRISGLIFTADSTESDFVVIDSTFRIVNTAGGGNYTPFIVYTSSRNVDGTIVPAGVYAEDLYVTKANIAQLKVDTAEIETAAITTLLIDGNAVTIPVSGSSGNLTGTGSLQAMVNLSLTLPVQSDVLLFWSIKQGYVSTIPTWGYQLRSANTGSVYDERYGMTFGNDQPSGQWLLLDEPAGSFSAQLRWIGQNSNISGIGTLTILVVQR